jgi:PAS domain S-box-containing protein
LIPIHRTPSTDDRGASETAPVPPVHDIAFYESEDDLTELATAFLAAGLAERDAIVAIVTPAHRAAVSAGLVERGFDVASLEARGRVRFLDAEETLASFVRDEMPDVNRFAAVVGGELDQAGRSGGGRVRAFSEMVDMLWRGGREMAALRLEELWHEMRECRPFSLLYAYTMENFRPGPDGDASAPAGDGVRAGGILRADRPDACDTEVARLRRRSAALSGEAAGGRAAETARAAFAAIVESTHDAVMSLDPSGLITSWNRGASRLYGYAPEEVIGRPSSILMPEDHADEFPRLMDAIRRGELLQDYETVRVAKDGRRVDVSLTISPIRNSRGEIVGASKIARDIGDRKRAEAALQEQDRRKDIFLATLAHELRNPLAPLRNGLELLTAAPEDREIHLEALAMMRRQIDHMVRLVDDLLDISRISRDMLHLRTGRFQLRHLIDCALETGRPVIEARHHRVVVQYPPEPIIVDADATRITQVFANLLNNAAKFTPNGGHIEVEVRPEERHVVVAVRDYGVGIEPDMLPRVFDLFTQSAAAAQQGTGGLGIGLTLAKRLVELHGGTIHAESAGHGKGSTFTVRLPRIAAAPESTVTHVRRGSPGVVPLSVLVADDNVDAAESLASLLRMSGHDVRVANDGEQAIHAVRAFRPSVVILDLGMPRLSGYDAARRIREMSEGPCPMLIAVTGWGQESDRRRTKEAGFDLHLVKPIDFHALQEALGRARG